MLNHQTMDKLIALRLEGMAQALEEQRRQADISQLDFEERFALLVERQWLWRENRALAARLHHAQLKAAASLEDIDYRHPRGLKRAQIEQLRASQWVANHHNCLITGPTGCGIMPGTGLCRAV
jgi:DNA replication protein DnaC